MADKNPNRVKAGKAAWAKSPLNPKNKGKKKGGSRTAGNKKSGGGSGGGGGKRYNKRPSLAMSAVVVGGTVYILDLAPEQIDTLFDGIQEVVDAYNLDYTITGPGVVAVLIGLKALTSISPHGFGRKYRAFLAGWGLRP